MEERNERQKNKRCKTASHLTSTLNSAPLNAERISPRKPPHRMRAHRCSDIHPMMHNTYTRGLTYASQSQWINLTTWNQIGQGLPGQHNKYTNLKYSIPFKCLGFLMLSKAAFI